MNKLRVKQLRSQPRVRSGLESRDLKQRRLQGQEPRQKTTGFMSKTTALHVHHAF